MANLLYHKLFQIDFENDSIKFLRMHLMNGLVEDHNPVKNIPPLHKSSLGRFNHMICYRIQPNGHYFCKDLEANIQETYRPILLYPLSLLNLRQQNDFPKIKAKKLELSSMQIAE